MRVLTSLLLLVLLGIEPVPGHSQTYQPKESKPYRPDVEFFVEVTEDEAAEAAWNATMGGPESKKVMQACRLMETVILLSAGERGTPGSLWAAFAGNAGSSGIEAFDKLRPMNDHAPPVKMWLSLETTRLLLLAYRPQAAEPEQARRVKQEFRTGSEFIQRLQDTLRKSPEWTTADDELARSLAIGYMTQAYMNRESHGPPTLSTAVQKNDLTRTKRHQAPPPVDPEPHRSLTLHVAVAQGDLRAIRQHLNNGTDPNLGRNTKLFSFKPNSPTPLHVAAEHNQVEAARLLLESGADPNAVASYDGMIALRTPLKVAGEHGSLDVAYLLLQNGASLSWTSKTGDSFQKKLLGLAMQEGHYELARYLRTRANIDPFKTPPGGAKEGSPKEEVIVHKARRWFRNYRKSLANYVCDRTITYYDFGLYESKLEQLRRLLKENDSPGFLLPSLENPTATSTIQVIGGKEKYDFEEGDRFTHKYTSGDFLGIVGIVLSRGKLRWIGDEELRGVPVHVIGTSTKKLITYHFPRLDRRRKPDKGPTVGFTGKLYVEQETGKVLRYLAEDPIGLKPKHRLEDAAFIIDYDDVWIEGEAVWLPVGQFSVLHQKDGEFGLISKFHNYRKFRTETKLTFTN